MLLGACLKKSHLSKAGGPTVISGIGHLRHDAETQLALTTDETNVVIQVDFCRCPSARVLVRHTVATPPVAFALITVAVRCSDVTFLPLYAVKIDVLAW